MGCSVVRNLDEWVLSTSADRAIRIELKISDFVDAWHAEKKSRFRFWGIPKHQMYPLVI
jgi:hypothetical protein